MDELYIAEKPSVGKAIAENLGGAAVPVRGSRGLTHFVVGNKVVTWVFGHILEQFEPEDYDKVFETPWTNGESRLPFIPEVWKLKVVASAKEQMSVIRDLAKQAKRIVHAGDPDREGQLLVDEVLEFIGNSAPVSRILPNAIDNVSMKKILADVRDNKDFRGLYEAGLGRQRADWLVGMNLTRACSISNSRSGMRGTLSVGRVQTPTLALVVKRDLEIENFKPQTFYDPKALFEHGKSQFFGTWKPGPNQAGMDSEKRLIDETVAKAIEAACKGQAGKITEYKVEAKSKQAPLPYSLSTLQIKASSLYKMSAQTVLKICQSLYETHKITSYPRSDCQYLPDEQFIQAPQVLAAIGKFDPSLGALVMGSSPQIKSRAWDSKKVTAHHGIIPTTNPNYASLSDPEQKIFLLIAKQYLAQFYPDYAFKSTSVVTNCAGHDFKSSGTTPSSLGWKKVFGAEMDEDEKEKDKDSQILPPMEKGDAVKCIALKSDKKLTKPPQRYTEGTLLRDMTNVSEMVPDPNLKKRLELCKGLGTVATQGAIIETLLKRNFLSSEKGNIISSKAGRDFIAVLPRELTDVVTTALWENALDLISKNQMPLSKFMEGQGMWVKKMTKQALEKNICIAIGFENAVVNKATAQAMKDLVGTTCPSCNKGTLVTKQAGKGDNKGNYFLACTNYPECKHTVNIEGQEEEKKGRGSSGGTRKKTTKRGETESS